jgi:hypothetical protein
MYEHVDNENGAAPEAKEGGKDMKWNQLVFIRRHSAVQLKNMGQRKPATGCHLPVRGNGRVTPPHKTREIRKVQKRRGVLT